MSMRATMEWDLTELASFAKLIWPRKAQAAIEASMKPAANLGLEMAKIVVHKDTWSLYKSGRLYDYVKKGGVHEIGFRFGGYVTNPKTGRLVDYAQIHEDYLVATEGRGYVEAGMIEMGNRYPQILGVELRARTGPF